MAVDSGFCSGEPMIGLPEGLASDSARDEARFVALWGRTVPDSAAASTVYARLRVLYAEPQRHYHSFNHIRRCLDEFDPASDLVENPDTVEMALWFHDAIYVPGAKDNELRSVKLFRQCAAGCAKPMFARRVSDLIMATTHIDIPGQADARLITDIDLCSFGLPWEQFAWDGQQIRAECPQTSDQKYFAGLLRFLQRLLGRQPTFFLTDHFERRYGQIARANTLRLVEELQAHGYDGL